MPKSKAIRTESTPTQSTLEPPVTTPDATRWMAAIHHGENEDAVLEAVVAAVLATGAGGARRVLLFRAEPALGGYVGWLGVDAEDWSDELAPNPDNRRGFDLGGLSIDRVSKGLTARLRALRLPEGRLDGESFDGEEEDDPMSAEGSLLPSEREDLGPYRVHPIRCDGGVVAYLLAAYSREAGASPDRAGNELALWCAQGERALDRLALRRRESFHRTQLSHMREISRKLLFQSGGSETMSRVLRIACESTGAGLAALWLVDRSTQALYLAKAWSAGDVEDERELELMLRRLAEDVAWRRETPRIEAGACDPRLPEVERSLGSILAVPVLAVDQPRGAIVLCNKEGQPDGRGANFDRSDQEVLELYAAQLGVLTELSELSSSLSDHQRQIEQFRSERQHQQAMADLGETSVRLASEMESPMASVNGFARRVHRMLADDDANREYLEIVLREGERLERMIKEHLQFAALQRPRLGMSSLNHIVQATLAKRQPEIDRSRIRLLKKLAPELPALLLDEEKMQQAFENLVDSAVEGARSGGRVLVQTRQTKTHVILEVCHDGPPVSGDVLEHLFLPFATGGRPGVAMGLALADRVIRDHGGEIGVKARGDWGHIVAISLPVQDNSDRRGRIDRRRLPGRDRRNRFPLR